MLETDRLLLRPVLSSDTAALHEGYTDPAAMEWWHLPISDSIEETERRVEGLQRSPAELAICLRGTDEAIGHAGWLAAPEGRRGSFGYFLRREHWGKGLATEAARAVLAYGFETFSTAGAELWVYEGNARSAALAERLGCTLRGRFVAFNLARGRAFDTRVYGITAQEADPTSTVVDPPRFLGLIPSIEVADVDAAIAYWTERLGFHVEFSVGDPPEMVSMSRTDWTPLGASVRFRSGGSPDGRALAGQLDVPVADVDRVHGEVVAAGTEIATPLATQPWGLREFTVVDPNGVRVRFYAPAVG